VLSYYCPYYLTGQTQQQPNFAQVTTTANLAVSPAKPSKEPNKKTLKITLIK